MFRYYPIGYIRLFSGLPIRQTVISTNRLISVKVPTISKPSLPNLETKDHPTAKGKLKRRVFQRFFDYLVGDHSYIQFI